MQARLVRQNPLRRKLAPRRCLKWGVLIKHAHMCVCAGEQMSNSWLGANIWRALCVAQHTNLQVHKTYKCTKRVRVCAKCVCRVCVWVCGEFTPADLDKFGQHIHTHTHMNSTQWQLPGGCPLICTFHTRTRSPAPRNECPTEWHICAQVNNFES